MALDSGVDDWKRLAPGAIQNLCKEGESAREGYSRRLRDTYGVVSSEVSSLDAGLEFSSLKISLPETVSEELQEMKSTGMTPGGEVILDASSMWAHSVEMAFGFYYRWVWPGGVVDQEWLDRRKQWRVFVRDVLRHNRRGYDSPLQVSNACRNGEYPESPFLEWTAIKDRVKPATEAVWIDTGVLEKTAKIMNTKDFTAITWVHHRTVGDKLSEISGHPYFGAGDETILDYKDPCIASIGAHSIGKNLQVYNQNIVLYCPSAGATWEQLISRTHRPHQLEDTVYFMVAQHTLELRSAFERALTDSLYIEKTMGQPQKLRMATLNMGQHLDF